MRSDTKAQSMIFGALLGLMMLFPASGQTRETDSLEQYAQQVFEKFQQAWSSQASENRSFTGGEVTFTLNADGTLKQSRLDISSFKPDAGREVLDTLEKIVPFGPFPKSLKGKQVQFKVKLTPTRLELSGYGTMPEPANRPSPLITIEPGVETPTTATAGGRVMIARSTSAGNNAEPVIPPEAPRFLDPRLNQEQVMADYIETIQNQVKTHWKWPGEPSENQRFNRAVALLSIDRDGSLLSALIKNSSGNGAIDKAAMKTIFQAAPFPPVPGSFKAMPLEIEYIFEPVTQAVPGTSASANTDDMPLLPME